MIDIYTGIDHIRVSYDVPFSLSALPCALYSVFSRSVLSYVSYDLSHSRSTWLHLNSFIPMVMARITPSWAHQFFDAQMTNGLLCCIFSKMENTWRNERKYWIRWESTDWEWYTLPNSGYQLIWWYRCWNCHDSFYRVAVLGRTPMCMMGTPSCTRSLKLLTTQENTTVIE